MSVKMRAAAVAGFAMVAWLAPWAASAQSARIPLKLDPSSLSSARAPDLRKWFDERRSAGPTAEDKWHMGVVLENCHAWLNDLSRFHRSWPRRFEDMNWGSERRRDMALAERKRCEGFASMPDLLEEAERLVRESKAEGSTASLVDRLRDMRRSQPHAAADFAIDVVLASQDAGAFGGILAYLLADEAHSRMREHPYFNVKAFTEAWTSVACRAMPCGPGSPWQKQACIARGHCEWSSHEEFVRATFTPAEYAEYVKLREFIIDVLRTRQWDRIGIRSKRYPGIEQVNRMPPQVPRYPADRPTYR